MVLVVKDLFVNLSILNFFILFGGYLLREKEVDKLDFKSKACIGIFGGISGVLIMMYTVKIFEGAPFLDLRFLVLMAIAFFGGVTSTFITAIITIIARLLYEFNITSFIGVGLLVIDTILYIFINNLNKLSTCKKWIYMHIASLILYIPVLSGLINDIALSKHLLPIYTLMCTISSAIVFLMIKYVKDANENYLNLKRKSDIDFLTGLYNTRKFKEALSYLVNNKCKNQLPFSCIMIDIDFFKHVNDTYGHYSGDLVLKEVAKIIKENITTNDIAARIGGEEFCILSPNRNLKSTSILANNIKIKIRNHNFKIDNDKLINITASLGISNYPESNINVNDILKTADKALYISKNTGRNKVSIFNCEKCI